MSRKKHRVYSDEFKREALELAENSEKSIAQIERDLGITKGMLYKWRARYQISDLPEKAIEPGEIEQLKARLRQMEHEIKVLRQEREILKKTVQIFSQDEPA